MQYIYKNQEAEESMRLLGIKKVNMKEKVNMARG